ncbi:hypothetical protein FH972_017466 [Carpinus fangiana]|uniref:Uncharacterized protein n=1 Tax=Carpinus fangiana TaxID=176857 RepID=A0A5N6RMF5_9ROSI|nr:hypothetical protein FH972_017466 [Carpinus fangiana]
MPQARVLLAIIFSSSLLLLAASAKQSSEWKKPNTQQPETSHSALKSPPTPPLATAGVPPRPQPGEEAFQRADPEMEQEAHPLRAPMGQQALPGLPDDPFLRPLRREPILGEVRPLDGDGGGAIVGQGAQVLQSSFEHLRSGPNVRPLHAGCVEGLVADRMRAQEVFERRYISAAHPAQD